MRQLATLVTSAVMVGSEQLATAAGILKCEQLLIAPLAGAVMLTCKQPATITYMCIYVNMYTTER